MPSPFSSSIRRLLGVARPEWPRLLAGTLFLALGSAMGLAFPQVIKHLIDQALGGAQKTSLDSAALLMIVLVAIQGAAIAARYYLFSTTGERVVTRLREQLYSALLKQEIAFFDERKTGELTSRLASDTTVLQSTASTNISIGLRNLAQVLGGLGLMLYTSPRLTLLMLVTVPPVALGAWAYGRKVRKLSRDVQDTLAESNEVAEETLSGIRTVRSFAAEPKELQRYGQAVSRSYELARKRAGLAAAFMGVASFAGYSAAAVVLWYGSRLVLGGVLTVGALTSFLIYTLIVAFSLGSLSDVWADWMKATGAAQRVFELLDRLPLMPSNGGEVLRRVEGRVEFNGVQFSYGARKDVPVLQGIDFTIEPGRVIALVGPSGSGKSTVAALLGRLYDPSSGSIRLDGQDLRALSPPWLRSQIGTVAQEPLLFSTSIAENIRYGRPDATDAEVEAAARAANAHEFIERFPERYQTRVGERGIQLSGGQKQRVAIARAVLKDPRILILDEATSALDAQSEHWVKEALQRLMKGRTTLIIAHRLSTVVDADQVLVLESGRVVQRGSHSGLLNEDGLYRRLVERQFVAA